MNAYLKSKYFTNFAQVSSVSWEETKIIIMGDLPNSLATLARIFLNKAIDE